MKRSILIAQDFLFGTGEVVIELSEQEVITVALELTLLLQGLESGISLRCQSGGKIDLVLGSSDKTTTVDNPSARHLRFQLGRHNAEYMQAVLLRMYRDKMAEVSHIHVEGRCGEKAQDLTLLLPR